MAMLEDYRSALRAGQRAYRACVARGQSPYLAVLDDILNGVNIVAQEPLGLVDIPAESIVGTKTSGRHTAFAANFMPLLEEDTEFAIKWSNLCEAHLEEGIHTPIIAYEYLNKFYVQEGNKRVSVLKYYEAVTIPGTVTRLVPARNDTLENKIYYEFLDFYKLSKINNVQFSRLGGYAKLQTLVCKAASEVWSDDDRLNFSALYTMFSQQFYALGGSALELTPGDALLVYLSVYRYSDACQSTPSQVRENLAKLWDEIKILTEPHAVELSLEPKPGSEPLLNKLNIFSKPSQLKVVFLHEYDAKNSAWVRGHEKGIEALKKEFPDRLIITNRENVSPEVDAEQIMEEVAHDNADVVFTTSIRMRPACLKVAAQHPKTRFLNCCLNAPHPLVRTYYPRTYEANYLLGMLAGILNLTDRVGYVAANPVYGVPAAINAFARGLRTVRPNSHILLRWACLQEPGKPLDFSDCPDIEDVYKRQDGPRVFCCKLLFHCLPSEWFFPYSVPISIDKTADSFIMDKVTTKHGLALSVIAARCHLPQSGRLWQSTQSLRFCQGLSLWESWTRSGLRGRALDREEPTMKSQALKGMRDLLPAEQTLRDYIPVSYTHLGSSPARRPLCFILFLRPAPLHRPRRGHRRPKHPARSASRIARTHGPGTDCQGRRWPHPLPADARCNRPHHTDNRGPRPAGSSR